MFLSGAANAGPPPAPPSEHEPPQSQSQPQPQYLVQAPAPAQTLTASAAAAAPSHAQLSPTVPAHVADSLERHRLEQLQRKRTFQRASQAARACMQCNRAKSACSNERPCARCVRMGMADECCERPERPGDRGGVTRQASAHRELADAALARLAAAHAARPAADAPAEGKRVALAVPPSLPGATGGVPDAGGAQAAGASAVSSSTSAVSLHDSFAEFFGGDAGGRHVDGAYPAHRMPGAGPAPARGAQATLLGQNDPTPAVRNYVVARGVSPPVAFATHDELEASARAAIRVASAEASIAQAFASLAGREGAGVGDIDAEPLVVDADDDVGGAARSSRTSGAAQAPGRGAQSSGLASMMVHQHAPSYRMPLVSEFLSSIRSLISPSRRTMPVMALPTRMDTRQAVRTYFTLLTRALMQHQSNVALDHVGFSLTSWGAVSLASLFGEPEESVRRTFSSLRLRQRVAPAQAFAMIVESDVRSLPIPAWSWSISSTPEAAPLDSETHVNDAAAALFGYTRERMESDMTRFNALWLPMHAMPESMPALVQMALMSMLDRTPTLSCPIVFRNALGEPFRAMLFISMVYVRDVPVRSTVFLTPMALPGRPARLPSPSPVRELSIGSDDPSAGLSAHTHSPVLDALVDAASARNSHMLARIRSLSAASMVSPATQPSDALASEPSALGAGSSDAAAATTLLGSTPEPTEASATTLDAGGGAAGGVRAMPSTASSPQLLSSLLGTDACAFPPAASLGALDADGAPLTPLSMPAAWPPADDYRMSPPASGTSLQPRFGEWGADRVATLAATDLVAADPGAMPWPGVARQRAHDEPQGGE